MRLFVGVYWDARRESILACAARLQSHFDIIGSMSPNLAYWYKKGGRKPRLAAPYDVRSMEVLAGLLSQGGNRRDIGGAAIPELGLGVSFWNGDAGSLSASTSVKCGLFAKGEGLSNFANMSIGFDDPSLAPAPGTMIELLRRLIEIWEPKTGRVEQSYVPPQGDEEVPEPQDILYASYWTRGAGCTERAGVVEPLGRGRLWVASDAAWKIAH